MIRSDNLEQTLKYLCKKFLRVGTYKLIPGDLRSRKPIIEEKENELSCPGHPRHGSIRVKKLS